MVVRLRQLLLSVVLHDLERRAGALLEKPRWLGLCYVVCRASVLCSDAGERIWIWRCC